MNQRAMMKPLALILSAIASLALGGCDPVTSPPAGDPPLAGAKIGGPFTLSDKHGKMVHWDQFKGQYRIVYFGYTFCPDACPTDVGVIMRGYNIYAKNHQSLAGQIQPLFITIDPARDIPAVVGEFAAAFSPRLMGLTGTPQQIADVTKSFGTYYAKGKQSSGGYLMDHSRNSFLMGRDGEPIALLPVDQGPQAVADELAHWVR
jgi:protein SCO1/2